jgi:hypothetical protein
MNTLLIFYDLSKPETSPEYVSLIDAIRKLGAWAKLMDSVWMVKSDLTTTQARDLLMKHRAASSERLLVIDVTSRRAAWIALPADVGEWIKQRI